MTTKLADLIEKAKTYVMTPAEIYEQRISFAYGNTKLSNTRVTKQMVREEAEKLYGPPPTEDR